jgi:hypothetical protein
MWLLDRAAGAEVPADRAS